MSIPFIRLFPDDHRAVEAVNRPGEVEFIAERFILAGGRYCIGVLESGRVKLTAVIGFEGETHEVATELSDNGPAMLDAVDKLIRDSAKHVEFAPANESAAG